MSDPATSSASRAATPSSAFAACEGCTNPLVCESCALCYTKILEADWKAREAYIAAGVCSECGACSAKEAETKCKPRRDFTDEWTCAGEILWQEPRKPNDPSPRAGKRIDHENEIEK